MQARVTGILLAAMALQAALAVGLAAWAAHGLEAAFGAEAVRRVHVATGMVLVHAPTVVALLARPPLARLFMAAAALLVLGSLLFGGALYGLAFGGPRLLGAVAPLGGLSLIAGWLVLAFAALRRAA